MAISTPIPPAGAPQVPLGLSGLAQMFGQDMRDVTTEAMLQRLRPALRLIQELEELLEQAPEITPIVQAVLQSKFVRKRPGAVQTAKDQVGPQRMPLGIPGASEMIPGLPLPLGPIPGPRLGF